MPVIPIDSPDDPRVADYMQVREAELRKDRYDAPGGLFVAEGELVVRRLFSSRYLTRSLLLTDSRVRPMQDLIDRLQPQTPVYVVDQPTMNKVVGFNIHRGVLAIGLRGPAPAASDLLKSSRCLVLLENLSNHDNLGGIFRNVAGLGAGCLGHTSILMSPKCADPLYRKSIRVSMGSALQVPFATLPDWPGGFAEIRGAGFRVAALTPRAEATDIDSFATTIKHDGSKIAILVGAEGPGLTPEAMYSADVLLRIEMPGVSSTEICENGGFDSLNVGVATAIALHRLFPIEKIEQS